MVLQDSSHRAVRGFEASSGRPRRISDASTLYEPEVSPNELIYAIFSGNQNQIRQLASVGVNITPEDSWIIYEALIQGPDTIEALAQHPEMGLNPELPGQMGDRVFHFLLRAPSSRFPSGKLNTIACLLKKGIDPLQPDRQGNTALHLLAANTEPDSHAIMHLLLGNNASCRTGIDLENGNGTSNSVAEGGTTALMIAVRSNHKACARLLLDHNANPNAKGVFNSTPLHLAVIGDFVGIARLLLDHGAIPEEGLTGRSEEMAKVLTCISMS